MDFEKILEKLRAGEKLTKEEIEHFTTLEGKFVSSGKIDKSTSMSGEEQRQLLDEAQAIITNSPEMQKLQRETIASRKTDRLTKRYAPFFNAILAGADIATSIGQINRSNQALQGLTRPGVPIPPALDPALEGAVRSAQQGTMDAARVAGPARQEIQDQYAKDLALARSVGGGQAGTYGAYGQVASMRRGRAAAGLVPLVDSVRAREQGRLDQLLNSRANLQNQAYYNRIRNSQVALDQYNQDAAAAGALGSAGRQNLRTSMQSLLGAVPGVAARLGGNPRAYSDRYSNYEANINNSLTGGQLPLQKGRYPWMEGQIQLNTDLPNTYDQYNWNY